MAKNDRGLARAGMSAEEWDYYHAQQFNPEDPRQNPKGHIYHHGSHNNSGGAKKLQDRINNAINKLLDLDIPESDKNEIIRALTK